MPDRKRRKLTPVHSLTEIPEFQSEDEEAEFWGTHCFGPELLEQGEGLPAEAFPAGWDEYEKARARYPRRRAGQG